MYCRPSCLGEIIDIDIYDCYLEKYTTKYINITYSYYMHNVHINQFFLIKYSVFYLYNIWEP